MRNYFVPLVACFLKTILIYFIFQLFDLLELNYY